MRNGHKEIVVNVGRAYRSEVTCGDRSHRNSAHKQFGVPGSCCSQRVGLGAPRRDAYEQIVAHGASRRCCAKSRLPQPPGESQIRALDSTAAGLADEKEAGTMTHDHKSHGTTALSAAAAGTSGE
jgi:hypothetical protein